MKDALPNLAFSLVLNIHINFNMIILYRDENLATSSCYLIVALVGLAFSDKQEPAFSNLRMFQALGFTVGYLYSNHLCEYLKLYIAGGQLVLSMILVFVVEFRLKRNAPKNGNLVI
mgnify:CR=1 FL=1